MLADDTIRAVLRTSWHLQPDGLTPLTRGVNSFAWLVSIGRDRYVAKAVHYSRQQRLVAGLSASEYLSARGIWAGTPRRCIDGGISTQVNYAAAEGDLEPADTMELPSLPPDPRGSDGPMVLALLGFVQGRPLDLLDPVDQLWWGDRLAACHRALSTFTHPGTGLWQTLRAEAGHLNVQPWLRTAIRHAVEAREKLMVLDRLTFGFLHGDPRPEAFLLDVDTGGVGVTGWGHVCVGPLLYDLASAVMYAGGTEQAESLVDAYGSAGVVPKAELESALPTLVRLRWAVQADYFARRISRESTPEDLRGLFEARDALLG